jgi:hypothetical protein
MFSESRAFEIELDEVGNIMTDDLYIGVIKNGEEKITDARIVTSVT